MTPRFQRRVSATEGPCCTGVVSAAAEGAVPGATWTPPPMMCLGAWPPLVSSRQPVGVGCSTLLTGRGLVRTKASTCLRTPTSLERENAAWPDLSEVRGGGERSTASSRPAFRALHVRMRTDAHIPAIPGQPGAAADVPRCLLGRARTSLLSARSTRSTLGPCWSPRGGQTVRRCVIVQQAWTSAPGLLQGWQDPGRSSAGPGDPEERVEKCDHLSQQCAQKRASGRLGVGGAGR